MKLRAFLVALALLGGGCTFDRWGTAPGRTLDAPFTPADIPADRSRPDQKIDGAARRDRASDQATASLEPAADRASSEGAPDRGEDVAGRDASPDRASPDASPPDSRPPQPEAAPSCLAKYGGVVVDVFKLCAPPLGSCAFYFFLAGKATCLDLCGQGGGTCIESRYDTKDGCETSGPETCEFAHADAVCVCSAP